MGITMIGRAFAALAEGYWLASKGEEPAQPEALQALAAAGERYRRSDAEFDDELNEWTPLSRLVAIAFAASPDEIASLKGELASEGDDDRA